MKTVVAFNVRGPVVRADYTLQVDELAKLIRITDQDLGNMTVTNDLERVLIEVAAQIDDTLDAYSITYRDSTGIWDRIIVTPHETLAHTFDIEVRPGVDTSARDRMVTP